MSAAMFARWLRTPSVTASLVALMLVRAGQALVLSPQGLPDQHICWAYARLNAPAMAGLVYVPASLACFVQPVRLFSRTVPIVACKTRSRLMLRCAASVLQAAAIISAVLTAAPLPALLVRFPAPAFTPTYLLCSWAMQTQFFTVVGLLLNALLWATGVLPVGVVAALIYGVWDFMALSVPGGGVPLVGWVIAGVDVPPDLAATAHDALRLVLLAGALASAAFTCARRRDILTNREV